ncbi:manganese efflux pump MntP family protein [Paenibacillus lentus]|uniref:Putative manganese efflux pump MntP n=1 Tax=Paenibacillus lentus TaxID=1338368 RepID=A0A3S8RSP0_9BACL|nr:manganese efflux pump MntP family protein [Paenibacillus lentus]AZK45860.1 manganese efflux pump [Paenibacillus lentus]
MAAVYDRLGELLTIILMAIALGMDAFSLGIGIGMRGVRWGEMLRIGVLVAFFHLLMPLVGVVAGQYAGEILGGLAKYVSGSLLVLLGGHMIWNSLFGKDEQAVDYRSFLGILLFSLSVSVDSFSVGVSLGMSRSSLLLTVIAFGLVGGMMSILGLLFGRGVGERLGEYGEAAGGAILLAFGLIFIF